jgi:hypothetical protein
MGTTQPPAHSPPSPGPLDLHSAPLSCAPASYHTHNPAALPCHTPRTPAFLSRLTPPCAPPSQRQSDALPELSSALRRGLRLTLRKLNLGWNPLNSAPPTMPSSLLLSDGTGDGVPGVVGAEGWVGVGQEPPPAAVAVAVGVGVAGGGGMSPSLEELACVLARCPQLEVLNISNIDLGAGAPAFVAGLSAPAAGAAITVLNVSWNRIGARGAAAFGNLFRYGACRNLACLDLSYNHIGDAGVRALAQQWRDPGCPPPPALEVHIMGNQLSGCITNVAARGLALALEPPRTSALNPFRAGIPPGLSPTGRLSAAGQAFLRGAVPRGPPHPTPGE